MPSSNEAEVSDASGAAPMPDDKNEAPDDADADADAADAAPEAPDYNPDKDLERLLKRVVGRIRLAKDEKRRAVKAMEDRLVKAMGDEDALFRALYRRTEITGSVKRRLKVERYNEFDVNLCMRLPRRNTRPSAAAKAGEEEAVGERLKLEESRNHRGWYTCKFPAEELDWPEPRKKHRKAWRGVVSFEKDDDGARWARVEGGGVRKWLQGVVHRAVRRCRREQSGGEGPGGDWEEVTETRSGPAITIKLKLPQGEDSGDDDEEGEEEDKVVSIDLVPCFEVPEGMAPSSLSRELDDVTLGGGPDPSFHLVPVPPRTARGEQSPPGHLLRGTFPTFEERLFAKKKCLNDVIRLLKVAKNHLELKPIASFFVYNACSNWDREQKRAVGPGDPEDQHLERIGAAFEGVLAELARSLEKRTLPMTLEPACNLLAKVDPTFCSNTANRLGRLRRRLAEAKAAGSRERIESILNLFFPGEYLTTIGGAGDEEDGD